MPDDFDQLGVAEIADPHAAQHAYVQRGQPCCPEPCLMAVGIKRRSCIAIPLINADQQLAAYPGPVRLMGSMGPKLPAPACQPLQ